MPPTESAGQAMHREILDKFGPDLAVGAREVLEGRFRMASGSASTRPAQVAQDLIGFLFSDEGRAYLRPDFKHSDGVPLVRRVLGRLPLDPAAVETAARSWHLELSAHDPKGNPPSAGQIARQAIERLHSRQGEWARPGSHEPSFEGRQIRYALTQIFRHLVNHQAVTDAACEELAQGRYFATQEDANRQVAQLLQHPWHASRLTISGKPLTDQEIDWGRPEFRTTSGAAGPNQHQHTVRGM